MAGHEDHLAFVDGQGQALQGIMAAGIALGDILEADQGNRRQAVALFQQVLSLRPGTGPEAEANYRLGELYASLGERERAVSHLTAALEKAPGGPWGTKSEESLQRLR